MPELPETETIARDLDREISGARITEVHVTKGDVLREVSARELRRRLRGASITRGWRRAKLVVLDLSTGDHLVVQPRFTGALLIDTGDLPERERVYSTLELALDDGRSIHYRDIRRLGTVSLMHHERFERYSSALGIEPLDPAFTAEHLSVLLRGSRQAVKKVLMDQRAVAGIGNIYANEALWRARVDPSRVAHRVSPDEAERLRSAIVDVLTESIAARGTSFRDYRDASGARGGFVERLAVYGRAGELCPRCGARLVGTHAIDGRMTVLCARCQS
ncbi:MAG TPA: bifunctional DNA-formamidopyrimidine glycosylase/DNA-(apurinic or apyrimidinic site) lyase [Gemmatimonadaceae bacterium]|jgi:formamidopyrimidine-DNA glycosylase|nr:bifunctional DNA-formamidopyrimidine glycosylase/DNA-(apurinic or apyrimidinic site) lyase [Gemmatimonadaceae bacterium]